MYHTMHTTTSTAVVEIPLDSTAQPVATEHAVPSSLPQVQLPLVIGKNQLLTITIIARYVCTNFRPPLVHVPQSHDIAPMGSALYIFVKQGG